MSVSLKSDSGGSAGSVQLNGVDVIPFNSNGILATALLAMATAAGFAISLAANGYLKLPSWLGGLIIQWGILAHSSVDVSTATATFPLAFPNACFSVTANEEVSNKAVMVTVFSIGTTQFSVLVANKTNGTANGTQVRWMAVGH